MPLAFTIGLLLLLVQETIAQNYPETEPNNTFATANNLRRYPDSLLATANAAGGIDYYKFDLSYYINTLQAKVGTVVVYLTVTNNGNTGDAIKAEVFNGLMENGIAGSQEWNDIPAGATANKSLNVCGTAMDDFYLAISSAGNFSYKMIWYYSDANPNTEPNNTRATANTISYNTFAEYREAIQYQYRHDPYTDTVDYIKTVLPPNDYNNVSLKITGKNNSCQNGQWIRYAVYKNEEPTPFQTGYVGNTPAVAMYTEVTSVISLANMQQGNTLYIKIWSEKAFGYELSFNEEVIEFEEETYDFDYEGYSWTDLAENESVTAQVGYHVYENGEPQYNEDGYPIIDNYDSYGIQVPADGALTLYVSGLNNDCGNSLLFDLMDEYGSTISYWDYRTLITWEGNCGETKSAVIRIPAVMAGTYLIRIYTDNSGNNNRMSYSLRYETNPYNSGGQTDPEPNNTVGFSTPIEAGATAKGYVKFISENLDELDIYRTTMATEAKITVYVKATYRGDSKPANNDNALTFNCANNNFTRRIPLNRPVTNMTQDMVYLDTFQVAAVPQGNVRFTLYSYEPYEYEFRYEIEDAITGPNDTEPNNNFNQPQPVALTDTTHGRIGYVVDGSTDIYDVFRTVIPSDGTLKIYVKATNADEALQLGWDWLDLGVYDGRKTSYMYNERIARNEAVPLGATVYDTITICGVAADTIYFRFHSYQKFIYNFRAELINPTVNNSTEPDNNFATAHKLKSSQTYHGTVGYTNRGANDASDYYKATFGSKDTLRLAVKATNYGCAPAGLRIRIYNKQQNQLSTQLIGNNAAVAIGAEITDNISIPVIAPDSIYVRFESTVPFEYEFTTNALRPASFYTLSGDTTVCFGPQVYRAHNITDENITYEWSLPMGGGTITHTDSTATVTWNQSSNRIVQLILTNSAGSSEARQIAVIVNNDAPTKVPVAYNFARRLSTNGLPPGSSVQWFRNNVVIAGATDSIYYAAEGGDYTAKFVNDCGQGPSSNTISFPADAQTQTIASAGNRSVTMSPDLKIKLSANASSGLPVFYQLISGRGSIVNDTLYVEQTGTIIVKMTQPGNDAYSAATVVNDTITVTKGNHVITFDAITDKIYEPSGYFQLYATSSAGTGISYEVVSGNAYIDRHWFYYRGVGTVTVRAYHNGDFNYNAATPVERTFCIGVRTLDVIAGDPNPCLATYTYTTNKIPGAHFVWSLSGGGILTTKNDTAFVQWQTPGTHTLRVKANSTCDAEFTAERELVLTTSNNAPAAVSAMQPVDHIQEAQLPLTLSWIPGPNTTSYDLYVWDSAAVQPSTPYAANLTNISYALPKNSFAYNKTYKWRVVAKNPCSQTPGPIQHFSLIPLADLVVNEVLAPTTANSGQTITLSWKVTNAGPGKTLTDQSWTDAVFFSFDTVPNFRADINWNPNDWNSLITPLRPLLVTSKKNVTALNPGENYTNSVNFTLPLNYNQPIYVYVITDYRSNVPSPLQVTLVNDTLRAPHAIDITLSPVPDLRVDTVSMSSVTFSGSVVNLTYKVQNYGALTPAGSSWADSVFISQNPLFDRRLSMPVKFRKMDDSYYPNAKDAVTWNNTQLQTGESYTKSIEAVIPNNLFGTWFIYVQANANKTLYEGGFANNNLLHAQTEVYLTPTPQLVVNSLNVPVTTASVTQPFNVNWITHNDGFHDNVEKNKGHIIRMGSCPAPCPPGSPANSVCTSPAIIFDSLVHGSSYWVERVYLSKNPNGLEIANATLVSEVKHGVEHSGIYADLIHCPASVIGNFNVDNVIKPNGDYPKSASFNIPAGLTEGSYYVYVLTNATKSVFEYPGTPRITRSAQPVVIARPDLRVSTVEAPANVVGGQNFNIKYTVQNDGPGSVFKHNRKDRIYISIWPVFDANAQLVATHTYSEDIPAGTPVTHNITHKFTHATSGMHYVYVQTNFDSSFRETAMNNNISAGAPVLVNAAQATDLIVSSVNAADSFFTYRNSQLRYRVMNNGSGTTDGTWTDSIFISCSPVFNPANSFFIAKRLHSKKILPGEGYEDTLTLNIPYTFRIGNCFAETMYQQAYFFVKANADSAAYEGSAVNNNLAASGSVLIINPLIDHTVTKVTGANNTIAGRAYQINWTTKNIGYHPRVYGEYNSYTEQIYFSPDSVVNPNSIKGPNYLLYSTINQNDSINFNKTFTVPNMTTGDYYVIVVSNPTNGIAGEKVFNNNANMIRNAAGEAQKIHVIQPAMPDLVDTILVAPQTITVGQPFTVIHKITNKGTGATYPNSFTGELQLSKDLTISPHAERQLAWKTYKRVLESGESMLDTLNATMPMSTIAGNYVLIAHPNANGNVVELDATNNLGLSMVTVVVPEPVDLLTTAITHPDTVYLGYTIDTVKWIVQNSSPNLAEGITRDGVYLSASGQIDSTTSLMGLMQKNIKMRPLEYDTLKLTPLVTGLTEGNYFLGVRTDISNNIIESDKTNNTTISPTPIYVRVKELQLNVVENNTLHDVNRFYKLVIPDSLIGSTIMVSLTTNDSLTRRNELFVGGGYVPSPAQFDYKFERPNSGNQHIVIATVDKPIYYITVACPHPGETPQAIKLKAEKLPFSILLVNSSSGGNSGNVTVKIQGSLFAEGMTATLSNGSATIPASAVYFNNSTMAFATFNLKGRPVGIYNLSMTKTDGNTAVLTNGFSIVPPNNGGLITGSGPNTGSGDGNEPGCEPGAASGMNSQLVVELMVPPTALIGRPILIQVNYYNPTNNDVPAQTRLLSAEEGLKLALTRAGVSTGSTTIYLELTEPGGPPGIIRAGGGGTITIYTTAPARVPADPYILFKLK